MPELNYPGPYELRFFISATVSGVVLTHEHRVSTFLQVVGSPGDPFSEFSARDRDGNPIQLDTAVDDYVALIRGLYNDTNNTINYVELWEYENLSFNANFVSVYQIGVNGGAASPVIPAAQTIYTFRTTEGGILKLSFGETIRAAGARILPANFGATDEALTNYVIHTGDEGNGPGGWIRGRDTSYPFAVIATYPGQNEATFKRRYRQ